MRQRRSLRFRVSESFPMFAIITIMLSGTFLALGGCTLVISAHPAYSADKATFDEALIGSWRPEEDDADEAGDAVDDRAGDADANADDQVGGNEDDNDEAMFIVERGGDEESKVYRLTVKGMDDESGPGQLPLEMRLVKLGESVFADLSVSEESRDEIARRHGPLILPTHLILKVERGSGGDGDSDTLTVSFLEMDWIRDNAAEHGLAFTPLSDNEALITSETADLQAFLEKYADEEEAFMEMVFTRVIE